MPHGQSMRNYAKAFFAFATLALVGACADTASAPTAETPTVTAPANYTLIGSSVIFRVYNSEGTLKRIGDHALYMPAGAICDPLTSGYNSTMWDKPCTPLQGSILITATVFAGPDGQPYVDFQPAMRFAPDKEVMLFFRQAATATPVSVSVKYCNAIAYCYDESLTDASLKPFRINGTSIIGRRLKHFSGYAIIAGQECEYPGVVVTDENGNLWCDMGGAGLTRRSGYMVASGEDIETVMKPEQKHEDEK